MSKVECTAVNELVDLVRSRPLDRDSADDDLFGSSAPRAARLRGTPAPSLFEMPALPPAPVAPPAPIPSTIRAAAAPMPIPRARPVAALHLAAADESATSHVARYVPLGTLGRRFALPIAGLVGFGILTGIAYTRIAHHGDSSAATVPTPSQVALTAAAAIPPAPAAIVAPLPAAPAAPKLVDIRLDSTPPGASATLLSNGISTPLGSTPVDASVDPTKSYDVVFALAGQPSKVEHLDPSATQHVQVAFDAAPAAPTVAVAPAKASRHHAHQAPHAARVAAAAPAHHTSTASTKTVAAAEPATPDPGTGNGTLAIVTSTPCAILIDDKNTGLTSPQRAIPLPAGHHNVRLIAATQHVNKLVGVDISAHHTTRISPTF
jgi:hypothetical protein